MEEAKTFTTQYLTQVLTGHTIADVDQSLRREVSCKHLFQLLVLYENTSHLQIFYLFCMLYCLSIGRYISDLVTVLQVKYALQFPWHCSVPRWEARNFIEIYEQNYSWLKY